MIQKRDRRYTMTLAGRSGIEWNISFPFTCKFNVMSIGTPRPNTAHFAIYNLSESTRNEIYKDTFEKEIFMPVSFSAGYDGQTLPVVFTGNVYWANSYKQGTDRKSVV